MLNIPRYQQLDDMHIIKVKSTQQIPICNVYHNTTLKHHKEAILTTCKS